MSIPIPGGARDLRSAQAIAAVEVSRQEAELDTAFQAGIASAVATARGGYESFQIANEGAAAMQENARLMQRAYALGEAELQAFLLTRRQATAAVNNALQAQVIALKAYYGLLIDAHLIGAWSMTSQSVSSLRQRFAYFEAPSMIERCNMQNTVTIGLGRYER